MSALVDISPASEPDFEILAHIASVATAVNLIHRVLNPGPNIFDTSNQEQKIVARLHGQAANPQARIIKAVSKESGEILGYAVFRFNDGAPPPAAAAAPPPATNPPPATAPPQNPGAAELVTRISKEFEEAHIKHMSGKRHVFWAGLMVLPAHQRKGIGSAMLRHGFEKLGAAEVPIWLITQMNGHELYKKFGFEEVEVVDVDLSEYTGLYRGYGVYRSICMLRQPGPLA